MSWASSIVTTCLMPSRFQSHLVLHKTCIYLNGCHRSTTSQVGRKFTLHYLCFNIKSDSAHTFPLYHSHFCCAMQWPHLVFPKIYLRPPPNRVLNLNIITPCKLVHKLPVLRLHIFPVNYLSFDTKKCPTTEVPSYSINLRTNAGQVSCVISNRYTPSS